MGTERGSEMIIRETIPKLDLAWLKTHGFINRAPD
jgi:hypothetical protein